MSAGPDVEALWRDFANPPNSSRPRLWWHWMDGNIDPEGVRLDLEWMARSGAGGAQVFMGSLEGRRHQAERVSVGSPTWRAALAAAASSAREQDLELSVATSAGWSATGGPWVAPADAMRKLVFASTVVEGGSRVRVPLPALPTVTGPYADVPRPGGHAAGSATATLGGTSIVLALPDSSHLDPIDLDRIELGWSHLDPAAEPADDPLAVLTDGLFGPGLNLPRDPDDESEAWVLARLAVPQTVSAVTIGLPARIGFGAPPEADGSVEISTDGVRFTEVARLEPTGAPVRSVSFAPVDAAYIRLRLRGGPAGAAVPPVAEGVAPPRFGPAGPAAAFVVSQLQLWQGGRVHAAEQKAGFATAPDYYALDTDPVSAYPVLDPDQVIDVSSFLGPEGRLDWRAPPGRWRLLHLGWSLTGATNGPALPEDTGLEVDKLDPARVRAYLVRWLDLIESVAGAGQFGGLMSDSIEAGQQNWTEKLLDDFAARCGYDPTPWLPALAGWVVGDAGRTDRFLWDFRATIAAGYADYYATLAAVAHERGMLLYAEALEDRRPQLGDDQAMRSAADIPMGAVWFHEPGTKPPPTYVADVKGASSVAHVRGKRATGCESMTCWGRPWDQLPGDLKPVADLEFLLGVTMINLHTSPHQPAGIAAPGVAMASLLGLNFTRTEPYAESVRPLLDYLARCGHILSQGDPMGRIGYVHGEEAPVTGLFGSRLNDEIPRGYDYDYVDVTALDGLTVTTDGRVLTPGGARYDLLWLGGSCGRLSVRTVRRLARLRAAGATIAGPRPAASPSLADDPDDFERTVTALWDNVSRTPEVDRRPNGRVVESALDEAIDRLGLAPDWSAPDGIEIVGRVLGEGRVFFVVNRCGAAVDTAVELAIPGAVNRLEWWDPVWARRTGLPFTTIAPGRIRIERRLAPSESGIVVAVGDPRAVGAEPDPAPGAPVTLRVGSWRLETPAGERVVELGDLGTRPDWPTGATAATYTSTFFWPADAPASAWLDLGDVAGLARVAIDDTDHGVVWTAPHRIPLRGLAPGPHRIRVEVVTTWRNHLITAARRGAESPYLPTATLRPIGLLGPVTVSSP